MIRDATVDDIPDLIDLGRAAIRETNHPARMDRRKTKQLLFQCILQHKKRGQVRIWVVEIKGKVVGVFIGQIDTLYFSKELYATDLIFYVMPECRGHGIGLLKKFMKWATMTPKVVDITLQMSSGVEVERTEKLYDRMGFKRVGGCYVNYRGKDEQSSQKSL